METIENIDTQLITYGVAVHGETDSGWKITGLSPGMDPQESLKLINITSVGEISETWAKEFENGFGYFGRMAEGDRAIFALYYRSKIKSARGRHFVPRIVLSIPYRDYVEKLKCDHSVLFDLLAKYKEEKAPVECSGTPGTLPPLNEIQAEPEKTIKEQMQPLIEAVKNGMLNRELLINFVTALLYPEPHATLVWSGEKPDTPLILSTLFLLPVNLRQFVTFCTSVENPNVGNPRLKIIRKPASLENNTFLHMTENRFILKKSPKPALITELPALIVDDFMQQIEANTNGIEEMQLFVDEKIQQETPGLMEVNYKKRLIKNEVLAKLFHLRKEMKLPAPPDKPNKMLKLLKYRSQLETIRIEYLFDNTQILEQELRFVVEQFEIGILEIENEKQFKYIHDELTLLAHALPALSEEEQDALTNSLYATAEKVSLKTFFELYNILATIPALKKNIDANFFAKLNPKKIHGWQETFQLLTMVEEYEQFSALKNNEELYNQLPKPPIFNFFMTLLILFFHAKSKNDNSLKTLYGNLRSLQEDDKEKLFKVMTFGFKRLEKIDAGEYNYPFLMVAAHSFLYIKETTTDEQQKEYSRRFIQCFNQLCTSAPTPKLDEQIKNIIDKAQATAPSIASQLKRSNRQADFSHHLAECYKQLSTDASPFKEQGDTRRFLQQLDENKVSKYNLHLSTAALQVIMGQKALPAATVYRDYLAYLHRKKKMDDTDIINIKVILNNDPSPMSYPDLLLSTLKFAFFHRSERMLSQFVSFLFDMAKIYAKGKMTYIGNIEREFLKAIRENWRPSTAEEVIDIYRAVRDGLGKSFEDSILRIGLNSLPEDERMKCLSTSLNEIFNNLSLLIQDDRQNFERLISYIENANPATHSTLQYIYGDLTEISNNKDTIEKSIDKIKTLFKKLKKIK
jgi:hypothetical protein